MNFSGIRKAGFTLVELMIVVGIIGLLAVMVMPGLSYARTTSMRNSCKNNLRILFAAKEQYAFDNDQDAPDSMSEVVPTYVSRAPDCPAGGTYRLRRLERDVRCTLGSTLGHTI